MGPEIGTALAIGDCLRATREARGLNLEQAAETSGISKSHLSRLESSERQPSVASLLALSEAYGVPVGVLFGEPQGTTTIAVSPPDQPRHTSKGLAIAACSGYPGSSVIDALRLTIDPDREAPVPVRHAGEEWLYVLSGTLRLEYDGEVQLLTAGSAVHFNAEVPHRLGAEASVAEVLLVAAKPLRNLHTVH
jgi:transcriptional regulator with XRE-family HTH domain